MAGRTRTALRNTGIQAATQLVTWALSWVLLITLPRFLGDAGFGKLFFAISYGTIFSTLINLGINTYLTKQVAVTRENGGAAGADLQAMVANVLTGKVALAVGVYLLQSAVIFLLPYDGETRQVVLIVGAATAVGSLTLTAAGVFQGFEKLLAPSIGLIVEKTAATAGAVALLMAGRGLMAVSWVYLAAAVLNAAVVLVLLRRQVAYRPAWHGPLIRRVFVGGLPFLVWVIFGEIYVRIDVVMLSLMTSAAVVGWYGAAFRVYGTLLFVPHILNTAVFPALVRMGARKAGEADFARATERLLRYLLAVAAPIAVGTVLIADPFLLLLYGPGAFQNAGVPLKIMGLSILLVCVDVMLGATLIAKGREKAWSLMAVAAAVFNPAMNAWMIPLTQQHYGNGGIGAAAATFLTEAFMMIGALLLMPGGIFSHHSLFTVVRVVAATLGMALFLTLWPWTSIFAAIPAGAAVYIVLALLLKVVPPADLHHLYHAIFKES
jgi:O-antigen/teichoic acid export membrane protein